MPAPPIDYEAQFQKIPAHLLVLGTDLRIIDVNEKFIENTGRSRAELIGRHVFDVFPAADAQRAQMETAFRKAVAGERTDIREMHYAIPDPTGPEGAMREAWWSNTNVPVFTETGEVSHVVQVAEDVTALVKEQQLKNAILGELQHRIGNLLTVVLAVAKRTADNEDDLEGFLERFSDRLHALAKTQTYLVGENWQGGSLHALVEHHLSVHDNGEPERIVLDGPSVWVSAEQAQSISMALHELATNCAKYGAFSAPQGRVRISWAGRPRDGFRFHWIEEHANAGEQPTREGFGSMILTRIFPSQMGGVAERHFLPTGFRYQVAPDNPA